MTPLNRCARCDRPMKGAYGTCYRCREETKRKRLTFAEGRRQQCMRIPPYRPGALVRVLPEPHECDRHSCLCGRVLEVESMSVVITRANQNAALEWHCHLVGGRRISCKRVELAL